MEELEDQSLDATVNLGSKLITSIFAGESIEVAKALIEEDAPLWYQDEDGFSALHAACFREDSSLTQILIDKGAIWNAGTFSHRLDDLTLTKVSSRFKWQHCS
jgi:type IV protein arginine methyltransferase